MLSARPTRTLNPGGKNLTGKPDDSAYFRRRAVEEQVRAQLSTCAAARERHDELAAMYRFRAAMLSTHPQYCHSPAQEESPQAA